ncbi:hypothetical protein AKJ09_00251 [Labilithrix luteola]|uniref:Lipoprotein n=1 Tax=Labilithrix luteola TaxID=1391654 RepID=A0A0K1PJ91_9BACT|nr:hypothetical protein [Labilithrix luteola]AKU93587.1 hypothetical protein AKJ09_00251 [Labilithrix luteola]
MGSRRHHAAWMVLALGTALAGCAAPREVTPPIEISPGAAARIAQMDRFRLHDEDRKHMMQRPRVWVEEIPDEEANGSDAGATSEPNEGEASTARESPPDGMTP